MIDVLVGKWSAAVLRGSPHAYRIIQVEDDWFRKPDIGALIGLVLRLRRERYDAAIIVHRDPKLAGLLALSRIPIRVGLDLEGDGFLFTHPVLEESVAHEIEIYNQLLVPFGLQSDGTAMEVFPNDLQREEASRLWRESGLEGREVVIGLTPGGASNPGEVMPQRIWPHYAALASDLGGGQVRIVYFGGPGDRSLEAGLPMGNGQVSFIGKCDLLTTAELMRRCSLVVTHDSGPMHLAAAAGARTLSLFAPTDPLRKAPLGEGHRWIAADLPCAPCYHRGKWPKECTQDCIGSITVEKVGGVVREMLES